MYMYILQPLKKGQLPPKDKIAGPKVSIIERFYCALTLYMLIYYWRSMQTLMIGSTQSPTHLPRPPHPPKLKMNQITETPTMKTLPPSLVTGTPD